MEDAEDRVGVGPGVRHDFGRLQFGLLLQHDGEQHQAVAQGAGHGDAVQAGELVGDQVVERDPALLAEVARVRPGMDRANRHHEAQPVGGRHVAAAPGLGERDAVLGGDQRGVGAGQRFGPDVVLPHPAQSRPAQCGRVEPDQRLEPRIARLGQQHGADAGGDVAGPCAALAGMGEPVGKTGAGLHLKQQLGQIYPWQARGDRGLERDQAGRFLEFVEGGQDQLGAVHMHGRVLGQVGRGAPVGCIQALGKPRDLGPRIGRESEGAADRRPCRLPGWASQQTNPRVDVAQAG